MCNVNGETLKASESGLISKVRQRQRPFGEAAEEAMRDGARLRPACRSRTAPAWRPSGATRSTAPRASCTDAIVKRLQSRHLVASSGSRGFGYSATQIERLEDGRRRRGRRDSLVPA